MAGALCGALAACDMDDDGECRTCPYAGKSPVEITLAGMMAEPADGFAEGRATIARALPADVFNDSVPRNLPDGTTLWVFAEDVTTGGVELDDVEPKAYVVRDMTDGTQQLHPCEVDDEGNLVEEVSTPFFLMIDHTYKFRAVSPARKFVDRATDEEGNEVYALHVDNKEYVLATDDRYERTKAMEVTIQARADSVQIVRMNPIVNQTAQLEFTIEADEGNESIHSISVLPQGIEIAGVQDRYSAVQGDILWNWSTGDPLQAYLGDDNTRVQVRKDSQYEDALIQEREDGSLYIRCPILPTDAFSSSIIIIFNLQVNGSPTQFEMTLNRKIFEGACTYHYKGKVTIEDGITVITWQYVNWSDDIPIVPQSSAGRVMN